MSTDRGILSSREPAPVAPPAERVLRSDEKAAIVLFSLGPERAEKLFRSMDASEHRRFARAFSRLRDVRDEQATAVVDEFTQRLLKGQPLVGGSAEAREFLLKVLEPDAVEQLMAELDGVVGRDVWQRLSDTPEQRLARCLGQEKPQTIAVILSRLRPDKAARTLMLLPQERAQDVILRMAHLGRVDQAVLEDLQLSLTESFVSALEVEEAAGQPHRAIASMLSEMPQERVAALIGFLEERSPDTLQAVQKVMFRFEDIQAKIAPSALQVIIRNCDQETLVRALKLAMQAAPKVAEYFLENMSKRAAEQMRENMQAMGPMRQKDGQEAQAEIVRLIKELARSGEITLSEEADEEPLIE